MTSRSTSNAAPAAGPDLDLAILQAELARIDLLIRREFLRWQLAGQDPADAFRGLHISDAEATTLLARPFGASWGQTVSLSSEDVQLFSSALAQTDQRLKALVDESRQQGRTPALEHLATSFGLDEFDLNTLLICLAPSLDMRYERLYAFLQDDVTRKRPSVNLVLDLLCSADATDRLSHLSRFSEGAPLFRHRLLERDRGSGSGSLSMLGQSLTVDPAIISWLLGDYQPHGELGPHASMLAPGERAEDRLFAAEVLPQLEKALGTNQTDSSLIQWPIVVFCGRDEISQRAAARMLAHQQGRPLLTVDLAEAIGAGLPPAQTLGMALRDARLTGAIPFLAGWDVCLPQVIKSKPEADTPWLQEEDNPAPELLLQLCAFPGLIIVAGRDTWQAGGIDRERSLFWFDFPVPTYTQRQRLWQHFLQQASNGMATPRTIEALDLISLSGQFSLTTDQIRDAVATGRDRAAQRGEPLQRNDLFAAARAHSNQRLGSLARKIEPRYDWTDIILPEDQLAQLRELVITVHRRPQVLEEWGVGRKLASSSGVTVLFSGPPGTGKTMAAEVIAAELGLDLYKIDLSSIVSKYIGETEKNLERIFSEAQRSNAILFFDEADAIFGKRSEVKDAHDRYANIEISYLLQRMEAYDGVTILATNLRANLDDAFTRRLQFAVDFSFPDEDYRLRIWQTLFPQDVPREPDLDLALLAQRFKLAGGNIRNILVSAAYLAAEDGGRVEMKHLLHGTRRELQKMGRLVNDSDMTS